MNDASEIKNERDILRRLDHPGVVQLHNCFEESRSTYLVLEYALNGNLSSFASK
jgi:3-phosphoinositide dependent protein kinase-1